MSTVAHETTLTAEAVHFSYARKQVLTGVDAVVSAGEVLAVIGPNGSGKSTLIRCLAGIYRPSAGRVRLNGTALSDVPPRRLAQRIGYVPQASHEEQPFTVTDAVLMGRRPYSPWLTRSEDLDLVFDVMELLGIASLSGRYLGELSAGQKQKVLIARALAQEPEILLLDEPTSALDIRHQLEVLEIVRGQADRFGRGVVLVIHDLSLANRFADRMLLVSDGRGRHTGSPDEVVTSTLIRDVYGVHADIHRTRFGGLVQPIQSVGATLSDHMADQGVRS